MRMTSYDMRCYDLATDWLDCDETFQNILPEHQEQLRNRLAGDIQGAVEEFDIAEEMKELL